MALAAEPAVALGEPGEPDGRVCGKCGRAALEGDKFCAKCGATLPALAAPVVSDAIELACPNCGQPHTAADRFCAKCGQSLVAEVAPAAS